MVFSSVPLYLDTPNWQQHPNHQHQHQLLQGNGTHTGNHEIINSNNNNNNNNNHQQHLLPPPPLPHHHHAQVALGGGGGGGGGAPPSSIRPNSMAERARMAKIPPPEAPLKCPRCDSSNTKFCYFNNYSLSQPRHFCKACRRYWTRGGALRNVPVGGGCRRNKRSSSGNKSSTSSASATTAVTNSATLSKPSVSLSSAIGGMIPSGGGFMASLHNMAQLGMGNLGLNFGGSNSTNPLHHNNPLIDHHQLDNYGSTTTNINSLLNQHHHQVPSFPNFLGAFEIPGSSSSFQNIVEDDDHDDDNQQVGKSTSSMTTNIMSSMMMGSANSSQMVKMEDNNRQAGLNLEKGFFMGISSSDLNATSTTGNNNSNNNSNQFWGSNNTNNMWSTTTTTTTTSHLL